MASKRVVVIHGKLGANLSPCEGERGAYISSFYEPQIQIQLFDVLHSVNDEEIVSLAWEAVCEFILSAERPFRLTLVRKQKNTITLRDFLFLARSVESASDIHEWITMQEIQAVAQQHTRDGCFREPALEILERRFREDGDRENRLESAFKKSHMPLLAAHFFNSSEEDSMTDDLQIVSYLPTLIESLNLLYFLYHTVPADDLRLLSDNEVRRVLFALHLSAFLAEEDPSKLIRPRHISVHRKGSPYQENINKDELNKTAIYELINSKFLCVAICSLLIERSVVCVYNSARNSAAISDLLLFLRACIHPLQWCHLSGVRQIGNEGELHAIQIMLQFSHYFTNTYTCFNTSLDSAADSALLDSPFPFLCGVQRGAIDESPREDILVYDVEYCAFQYPLPRDVSRGLHLLRGLQREMDLVLRPHFHNLSPKETSICSAEEKVDRILLLAGTFVRDNLTQHLEKACLIINDPSGSTVVLDEKLYMETAGSNLASAVFQTDFLRTQHVSQLILTHLLP